MIAERRTARARFRPLPVAASAGAHLIVFSLLVWRLGTEPRVAEPPVMNVELAPLRRAPPPHEPAPRHPERTVIGEGAGSRSPSPAVLAHPPDAVTAGPPLPSGEAVQQTLRGLVGCQPAMLARLTPEARRRCEEQMASAKARDLGRAAGRLNLDLHGDYAKNPEPYLNRRPKNGCKPRAAGDVGPMGQQGAAAGVSCSWDF